MTEIEAVITIVAVVGIVYLLGLWFAKPKPDWLTEPFVAWHFR